MPDGGTSLRVTAIAVDQLNEPVRKLVEAVRSGEADAVLAVTTAHAPGDFEDFAATAPELLCSCPYDLAKADPALLALRAMARIQRFSGEGDELIAQLYEATSRLAVANRLDWASRAGRMWLDWAFFLIDVAEAFELGMLLRSRHPCLAEHSSSFVAGLAAMASATGNTTSSAILWDEVLHHPSTLQDADEYWSVRLDWARLELFSAQGSLPEAITNLSRAHEHFCQRTDPVSFYRYFSAGSDLTWQLTIAHEPHRALQVLEGIAGHCTPGSSFASHLEAIRALALAATGQWDALKASLEQTRPGSQFAGLPLVSTGPARMLRATSTRATDDLQAIVREMLEIESAHRTVAIHRATWRMFAAESYARLGVTHTAKWLCEEVEASCRLRPLPLFETWACSLLAMLAPDCATATRMANRALDTAARCSLDRWMARDETVLAATWVAAGAGTAHWSMARKVLSGAAPELVERALEMALKGPASHSEALQQMRADLGLEATTDDSLTADEGDMLEIQMLGCLRVVVNGIELPSRAWSNRRKARLLLARIALSPDTPNDRESLGTDLWPEVSPDTARQRVPTIMSAVRKMLASVADGSAQTRKVTTTLGGAYVLKLAPHDRCDAWEFRDEVRLCRRASTASDARQHGELAIALYRGDLLAGEDASAWAQNVRVSFRLMLAEAVLTMLGHGVVPPDATRLVEIFERGLATDITDETLCRAAMLLVASLGDTAGASALFHRTRRALRDEFGIAPCAELVRAHDATIATAPVLSLV